VLGRLNSGQVVVAQCQPLGSGFEFGAQRAKAMKSAPRNAMSSPVSTISLAVAG
jgi:hypothetical protein